MGTARFDKVMDYGLRGVDVAMRCDGCRRVRYLTAEELGNVFGPATAVAAAERRLKCSACGHRGARLAPVPKLGVK